MSRDMDLVRTLLLKIEALDIPPGAKAFIPYADDWFVIEGHDRNQAVNNLRMLYDGGFVAGPGADMSAFGIVGLTWKGAELLDSARNPDVWTRTRAAAKKLGGVTFEMLMEIAKIEGKRLITEKLGPLLP